MVGKVAGNYRRTTKSIVAGGDRFQTTEAKRLKNRGVILVLLLLVAGLTAAGVAIWHQYRQTRRALEFWGADVAYLIGHAESVELSALEDTVERLTMDISQARGLVHFRRSLLEDENFQWDAATPSISEEDWDFAVRFSGDNGTVTLMFDFDQGVVANGAPVSRKLALTERLSQGLSQFFNEMLERAAE